MRIKDNTQEWFDNETAEAIKIREKYFKKKIKNLTFKYLTWSSSTIHFRTIFFLFYISAISQASECELLLYADDTCLIFQHKNITKIEMTRNKNFSMLCDCFVDNKVNIHFGEDKTRLILFGSKHKIKNLKPLNIQYKDNKVTYLGCILEETSQENPWSFMLQIR